MSSDIYAMVLNWNGADDTIRCLESLNRIDREDLRRVVVDNGSSDDSVARIQRAFPDVELMTTGSNLGYAGGNNYGLRRLLERKPEFICLLNNDIVVEPGFLDSLLACARRDARAGIIGPQVLFLDRPDVVWSQKISVDPLTGRIVSREHGRSADDKAKPKTAGAVSGAVMLIRRETLESVGLFDERYAFYHEDVDLCLRAKRAGWKTMVVPEAVVRHRVGGAMNVSGGADDIYYLVRNHLLVINSAFPIPFLFRLPRNLLIVSYNLLFLLFTTRKGNAAALRAWAEGIRDYLRRRWGMRRRPADRPEDLY